MTAKKMLTVLVGAGASHNCVDNLHEFREELEPPLVNDLFANRHSLNQILMQYPKAGALSPTIRSRVQGGEQLESVLKDLADTDNPNLKKQFWQVPLYLQHLFYTISQYYVTGGGTKFDALVRSIQSSQYEKVFYLTVNYDLFLDRSIQTLYGLTFDSPASYWHEEDHPQGWIFAKLHGSVNWGKSIRNLDPNVAPDGEILPILDTLSSDLKLSDDFLVSPIQTSHSPGENQLPSIERQNRALHSLRMAGTRVTHYPAISAPVEGKAAFHISAHQLDRIRSFLAECQDFLVIGFSGLDQHVVNLFEGVKEIRKLEIVTHNLDSSLQTLRKFAKVSEAFKRLMPSRSLPESLFPFDEHGFARFVVSRKLAHFLSS